MERLERKIDYFLEDWKIRKNHLPLIVKGARQVGKTEAIQHFGAKHYRNVVEINFALQPQYRSIFDDGFEVDEILKNITLRDNSIEFTPGETLIFFDELQDQPNAATSLKSFQRDGRFDVICSGSMMGINYQKIESNSVGNKEDYELSSLDFEEFLWAKGYRKAQIEDIYRHMLTLEPFSTTEMDVMLENFGEYMVVGGMPAIVKRFIDQKNYSGILEMQRQILKDYEEDITKYASGMDQARILNVYKKIPAFLGQDNKKFQISKVEKNARTREYYGATDWLERAGIVNICYCLAQPALPLRGNFTPDNYKVYFGDTGLLVGSLDEEVQADLRNNENLNAYKGALYENVVADLLRKAGQELFFYRNEKSTIEMDFFVRDPESLIPIEVKAVDRPTASLNNLIKSDKFPDIRFGIKLARKNLGFNGQFYTFPYFLAGFLKRWVLEKGRDLPD